MVYAAFILGVVNVVCISIPVLLWLFKGSKLDFRLTSEVFFRLLDNGESLFANAAIVPEKAAIKMIDVRVTLTKTDTPVKTYPLKVIAFGTKAPSKTPSAEHLFYTRSPYHYLPADQVVRPLWHCLLTHYSADFEGRFREFDNYLLEIEKQRRQQQQKASLASDLQKSVQAKIEESSAAIMEHVQLEPGKYRLVAEVVFQPRGGPLRRSMTKTTSSAITFSLDPKIRDHLREGLRRHLTARAGALLLRDNRSRDYPEYSPVDVREE